MTGLVVLFFPVGGDPEAKTIGADLASWQALVGGYVQEVPVGKYSLICNEEGRLRRLPPNRVLPKWGTIHGDFFLSAYDGRGWGRSLTPSEIRKLRDQSLSWPLVRSSRSEARS